MYNVLIVDDEPNIRKGLVQIVDWSHYNCVVIGEAMDGIDGLERISELKPDIVFVDINMPEMNGLEMMEKAKSIIPGSKFIILSGYRDFPYLQEAIRLGAFDYILKPSKIENICEVIKRATIELKYQNQKNTEISQLKEGFEKTLPILKEKLLYDLIYRRNVYDKGMEELLSLYHIVIDDFVMALINFNDEEGSISLEKRYLYQYGVMNTVHEMLDEQYEVAEVSLGAKEIALIIQSKQLEVKILHEKLESIHELIKNCFDYSISVAISSKGYGYQDIAVKKKECDKCLNYQFVLGKESIILFDDLVGFYQEKVGEDFEELDKRLINHIKSGDIEKVKEDLVIVKGRISEPVGASPDNIKMFYCNLVYGINMIRVSIKELSESERGNYPPKNIYSFYQLVDTCTDVFELHHLLEDVAVSVVEKINKYNQQNINATLQAAIDYLKKNYYQQINLEELASYVYVSPFYLSRMFKKELNQNFIDYLNCLRIEHAKKLLMETNLKTYEVAEKVGILDSHYFSKLFKKYTKITPTEYKAECNVKDVL